MPSKSTYEAEVVVIGGGLAGMVTALELLDAGKRVVMLDAATRERFGGLALWSFGGMFFVDSPEQRKSGIKDSVDLAMRDWVRYGELDPDDVWPYRWAEAYVNRCTEEVRREHLPRGRLDRTWVLRPRQLGASVPHRVGHR
jgi:predicted oxidoreductase